MSKGFTGGKQTIIITGGNQGLGFECAKNIAQSNQDWHIILACRNLENGRAAAHQLQILSSNPYIETLHLDLASLASVRSFAEEVKNRLTVDLPPLQALVCNAGLQIVGPTSYTQDGFETTFGVNHLGHYLLTQLLLPHLAARSQIIFVSSGTHDPAQHTGMPAPLYPGAEGLAFPQNCPGFAQPGESLNKIGRRRYTTSKLCNLYTTYELSRQLEKQKSTISVNAFDPGGMPNTGLTRQWSPTIRWITNNIIPVFIPVARLVGLHFSTVERSGRNLATLVLDSQFSAQTGQYYAGLKSIKSSALSYNRANALDLWNKSAELVKLKPAETIFTFPTVVG